jgi:hypothetical protein
VRRQPAHRQPRRPHARRRPVHPPVTSPGVPAPRRARVCRGRSCRRDRPATPAPGPAGRDARCARSSTTATFAMREGVVGARFYLMWSLCARVRFEPTRCCHRGGLSPVQTVRPVSCRPASSA